MHKFKLGIQMLVAIFLMGCKTTDNSAQWLVNHVGYELLGSKNAVLQLTVDKEPDSFQLLDTNGKVVFESAFEKGGKIDEWETGNAYAADFSEFKTAGEYRLRTKIGVKTIESATIVIGEQILAKELMLLLTNGIQSQRSAGAYEEKDKQMIFHGNRKDTVDVSGGWYDASGDRSKYLSHLSYANFLNPQQAPMVVWNFLASKSLISKYNGNDADVLKMALIDEASHGADWLVRMQDKEGYFYLNVFDNWSWDPEKRSICAYIGIEGVKNENYKSGYRMGGGMSVAALARAANDQVKGAFASTDYLLAAQKGFDYLEANNKKILPNGEENIIDDYCALMAANELYLATNNTKYLQAARKRMQSLASRITSDEQVNSYWSADATGERPFFHACEAGLPIVSLVRYLDAEKDEAYRIQAIDAIRKSVDFELWITSEVNNPFGYARQYVKATNEDKKRTAFFMAQNNETGYWWQGENARLASLASALFMANIFLTQEQQAASEAFAANQINWILGVNPYDMSMVEGAGRNNPLYIEGGVSKNVRGCVCNGITAAVANEKSITFLPYPQREDPANKWRWSEQWLQHGSWLLMALAASL